MSAIEGVSWSRIRTFAVVVAGPRTVHQIPSGIRCLCRDSYPCGAVVGAVINVDGVALFGVSDCVRQSPKTHKPKSDAGVRKKCELKSVSASKSSWLRARSSCQKIRCSWPIRRGRSRQSLLHGGEQPAGDARPRPAVDDRLPGRLPQHVVLRWRKCEHLIQLAGEIGRIAGLEGC